jgi:hypothetical protein
MVQSWPNNGFDLWWIGFYVLHRSQYHGRILHSADGRECMAIYFAQLDFIRAAMPAYKSSLPRSSPWHWICVIHNANSADFSLARRQHGRVAPPQETQYVISQRATDSINLRVHLMIEQSSMRLTIRPHSDMIQQIIFVGRGVDCWWSGQQVVGQNDKGSVAA